MLRTAPSSLLPTNRSSFARLLPRSLCQMTVSLSICLILKKVSEEKVRCKDVKWLPEPLWRNTPLCPIKRMKTELADGYNTWHRFTFSSYVLWSPLFSFAYSSVESASKCSCAAVLGCWYVCAWCVYQRCVSDARGGSSLYHLAWPMGDTVLQVPIKLIFAGSLDNDMSSMGSAKSIAMRRFCDVVSLWITL